MVIRNYYMVGPINFSEEILDFAQCYLYSGLTLSRQFSIKAPYKTITNNSKGYLLCSHFLIAHGIELYLKFLIKFLGATPRSDTHNLKILIKNINTLLLKSGYKRELFNKKEIILINSLDRYEKFRYPTDKHWNVIQEIFNESKNWTENKAKNLTKKFEKIIKKLNSCGYKIWRLSLQV